jgi:hypothetical protein
MTVNEADPIEHYIVVTPEGYYTGSASADRYVRFRIGSTLYPAESFQARYYRPDLVRQALSGKSITPGTPAPGAYPPLLAFLSPVSGSVVKEGTIVATLQASAQTEIKEVVLLVNGARVYAKPIEVGAKSVQGAGKAIEVGAKPIEVGAKPVEEARVPDAHKFTRRFSFTIPLPAASPTIKLQAMALDDDGLQSPREEIFLSREAAAPPTGNLLGLCVGVSQYKDKDLNLKFADADATELAAALNRQRGIYQSAKVASLTNEQATAENVTTALDRLLGQTSRDDTVVLFFSGHGWRADERSFYFATHEVDRQNITETALPWNEVVRRLAKLSEQSKRVIVLLDACHSGSAATNEEMVKAILSANAGVLVLASSKGSEVSLENDEWKHGIFTKALLESVSGQASPQQKQVTLWDFVVYVRRRVKELTEGAQNPQVPFLQDFDTDAAIVMQT